jgi:hypothetical protein
VDIDGKDYRSMIISSLPYDLANFASSQLAAARMFAPSKTIAPDTLISLISEEYDRQKTQRSRRSQKSRDNDDDDEAMATDSSSSGKKKRGVCWNCGGKDHYKDKCLELLEEKKKEEKAENVPKEESSANTAEEEDLEWEGAWIAMETDSESVASSGASPNLEIPDLFVSGVVDVASSPLDDRDWFSEVADEVDWFTEDVDEGDEGESGRNEIQMVVEGPGSVQDACINKGIGYKMPCSSATRLEGEKLVEIGETNADAPIISWITPIPSLIPYDADNINKPGIEGEKAPDMVVVVDRQGIGVEIVIVDVPPPFSNSQTPKNPTKIILVPTPGKFKDPTSRLKKPVSCARNNPTSHVEYSGAIEHEEKALQAAVNDAGANLLDIRAEAAVKISKIYQHDLKTLFLILLTYYSGRSLFKLLRATTRPDFTWDDAQRAFAAAFACQRGENLTVTVCDSDIYQALPVKTNPDLCWFEGEC